jgi:hypothetical protein
VGWGDSDMRIDYNAYHSMGQKKKKKQHIYPASKGFVIRKRSISKIFSMETSNSI